MNKKNILSGASLALIMGMSSCVGDLDVTPIDPSTNMEVNEPALYAKCYSNMALPGVWGANGDCDIDGLDGGTSGFVRQIFNANELTTDEAMCAWGDTGIPGFNYNQWDAANPMLQGLYYRLFAGINVCNHYLDVCKGVDATREAEIHFLRALYYYYLMDLYGNPAFTEEVAGAQPEQIKRADLFAWIEAELTSCIGNMQPSTARTSKDEGYGRADQDAANLLLARMYLNAQVYTGTAQWAKAQEYAEKVINGKHKLWTGGSATSVNELDGQSKWSSYQMLFMGDNGENGASIEAILPLIQTGGVTYNGDGSVAQYATTSWGTSLFLMASTWKDDMDTYSNYGTSEKWAGNRARSQFVAKFYPNGDAPQANVEDMQKGAKDSRALLYGIDRELHISTPGDFASGYAVAKFRNTYAGAGAPSHSQYPDADYFLMRSAEAYLIAAEAIARQKGNQCDATALGYLNQLRDRALAPRLTLANINDILDERSRELYYEGFRRTDLVRYGLFGGDNSRNYLWEWKGGQETGVGFNANLNVFGIPTEELNANTNLTQNPGY